MKQSDITVGTTYTNRRGTTERTVVDIFQSLADTPAVKYIDESDGSFRYASLRLFAAWAGGRKVEETT